MNNQPSNNSPGCGDPSDVTVIVPAFNEEKAIGGVIENLRKNLPGTRIIVVNDGSSDRTGEILAGISGIRVITHPMNRGYGASLKSGIRAAETEYVLMCDADGQHRLEDIIKLMDKRQDYDMVVGIRGEDSHRPLLRRPGKFILRHFANYLVGTKLPDFNSGLRVFRREVIARYMHLASDRFSFSTTSSFVMLKTGQRIGYVPIVVEKRIGKSAVRQLRHGSDTLMLMLRLTMLYDPLKVFLDVAKLSFLLAVVSVGYDCYSYGKLRMSQTSLLLVIFTVLVFLFGLVGDQIAALRRELHEK